MNPSIETLKKMPNGTPFFLQNQINVNQKTFYNNTREYLGDKNPFYERFFSNGNKSFLKDTIINKLFSKFNVYTYIDDEDLHFSMYNFYKTFFSSEFSNTDTKGNMDFLNEKVIHDLFNKKYNEQISKPKYKKDRESLLQPLDLPLQDDYKIYKNKGKYTNGCSIYNRNEIEFPINTREENKSLEYTFKHFF